MCRIKRALPCPLRPVRPGSRQLGIVVSETIVNYVGNVVYRPMPHVLAVIAVGLTAYYLIFLRRV